MGAENRGVDANRISKEAKDSILGLVAQCGKQVALFVDDDASGVLSAIAGASTLKQHGVAEFRFLSDSFIDGPAASTSKGNELAVLFILRPRFDRAAQLAKHLQEGMKQKRQRFVACLPMRSKAFERYVSQLVETGDTRFTAIEIDMTTRESDHISFVNPYAFEDSFSAFNPSTAFQCAKSISRLQKMTGAIPQVKGKGRTSKAISQIMTKMRKGDKREEEPQVDMLVLLDREADMVTPMCTQLTYQGLIEEVLPIKNDTVTFFDSEEKAEAKAQRKSGNAQKLKLDPKNDGLYRKMRDMPFAEACEVLRERANALQKGYKHLKGNALNAQNITDVRNFVKEIRGDSGTQSLDSHAGIARNLLNISRNRRFMKKLEVERYCVEGDPDEVENACAFLEDMIGRGDPIDEIFRLVTLISVTNGGVPKRHWPSLKRSLMLSKGHFHISSLLNKFERRLGVTEKRSENVNQNLIGNALSDFHSLSKMLRLVKDDTAGGGHGAERKDSGPQEKAQERMHSAFPHIGYAPLSVRLVMEMVNARAGMAHESVRSVHGQYFEHSQSFDSNSDPCEGKHSGLPDFHATAGKGRQPKVLVAFIGGITSAEVACLRQISTSSLLCRNAELLIASTSIETGRSLMRSAISEPV